VKFVEGYENYIFQITALLVSLTHVNLQFCAIATTEIAYSKSATYIHKGIHCDMSNTTKTFLNIVDKIFISVDYREQNAIHNSVINLKLIVCVYTPESSLLA